MKLSSGRAVKAAPAMPAFDPAAPDGYLWIIAAMCWPKDPRRQTEAVATWQLEAMARARHVAPFVQEMGEERAMAKFAADMELDPEALRFAPWTAAHVAQMGVPGAAYEAAMAGLSSVRGWEKAAADAPGTALLLAEMDAAAQVGAFIAGNLLLFVARLAECHPEVGSSLARAAAILEEAKRRKPFLPIPEESAIKDAWKAWRCVAPLWAAMHVASEFLADCTPGFSSAEGATEVLLMPNGRVAILGMAAWFRDFGIGHRPRHSGVLLLPEQECAAMPASTKAVKPLLKRLPDWAVQAARSASAGGRYRSNPLKRD